MKCMSAARIKNSKIGRKNIRALPADGSHIRKLYDTLQNNKGVPVVFNSDSRFHMYCRYLSDFYGMDIRQIQRGDKRVGRPSKFMLVGEWFGRVYVDYVSDRIEREFAQ